MTRRVTDPILSPAIASLIPKACTSSMPAAGTDRAATEKPDSGYPRLVADRTSETPPAQRRRKLATVLSADVVGFSRLMSFAEEETLDRLKIARGILCSNIERHGGRQFGVSGDSIMAEFDSPVEAVRAALHAQRSLAELNVGWQEERKLEFRVGIHIDDVIEDSEDLFGDGVNIAARVQAIAEPGGISISDNVHDHVRRKINLDYKIIRSPALKNIGRPISIYLINPNNNFSRKFLSVLPWRHPLSTYAVAGFSIVLLVFLAILGLTSAGKSIPHWRGGASQPLVKPAVAVLPFTPISQSEEESLFARGLADDISIDLQRFSGLQVVGKDSVQSIFEHRGIQAVVDELRPDYLVSASVTYFDQKIKLNISISKSSDGKQVWAQRYEMSGEHWYLIQEQMTRSVIYQIAHNVDEQEVFRISSKRGVAMNAYELRLRAKEFLNESTQEANEKAKMFANQALELDDQYVEAYNDIAYANIRDSQYGWSEDSEASLRKAKEMADRAISIDPENYIAHWAVATVSLYTGDYDRSLSEWNIAVQLNPQDPDVLASMVDILVAVGLTDQALTKISEARRINPNGPSWYDWNAGYVYYMLGRYSDAISSIEAIPDPEDLYLLELAASYAMRGEQGDEAKAVAALRRVREALPTYDLAEAERQPFQSARSREHWLGGVRRAFELLDRSSQAKP